jgi:hypothetical protein
MFDIRSTVAGLAAGDVHIGAHESFAGRKRKAAKRRREILNFAAKAADKKAKR